jgi:hypothetical protein
MKEKLCSGCKKKKALSAFDKANDRSSGRASRCKVCRKEYKLKNKEKYSKQQKDYYQKNKADKIVKSSKYTASRVKRLTDGYVKKVLKNRTNLKEFPIELIELKREQLKIHRYLKENHG